MRAIRLRNHLLRRKPASCIPSNLKWSKANPDFGNCKYCAVRADQIIVTDAKSPRAPLIAKMTLVLLPLAIPHAVRGQKAARDLSEASLEDLMTYAREAELDLDAFELCVTRRTHQAGVQKDVDEGIRAGVTGTPAFFINGRLVSGAQPLESFAQLIDQELARLR